ncbi:kynureninase [Asanoa iriomotensis]|uniref:Kynureninase n=1 Tax=Asanoa iriomotensis TaxID=234613 RepID=A0ABQ4C812_9ACTN|nr:kynureninase [Asanoa iriomotensis]GIF58921.1 kynureninase [Asanoa iriomotensis]
MPLILPGYGVGVPVDRLTQARRLDAEDPLAAFRDEFVIAEPDLVYLDGNSLGRLPKATRERLHAAIDQEWGVDLVRGWDRWIGLAREVGDLLAGGVVEAAPGEVVLGDSTSVNLYKLAVAACDARPGRRVVVTDDDNFPTDRYVLEGVAAARGMTLRVIPSGLDTGVTLAAVRDALDDDVALVSLSHVAYRSGAIADLPGITAAVHEAGALMLWDLCHSAGAVPAPLRSAGVDLAVGCTYKHLNGGPGAPAFLYVRQDLQAELRQPIWGWFGQRDQFAMGPAYDPAPSVDRFLVGTPPVLGGYGARCGIELSAAAGIERIFAKGTALGDFAIELYDEWLAPHGFTLASPRSGRGAHVTLHHPAAWQISQALRDASVIPDYRTPDRLRLGFAPLYTRFEEVHEGFQRLRTIMEAESWLRFSANRSRVT